MKNLPDRDFLWDGIYRQKAKSDPYLQWKISKILVVTNVIFFAIDFDQFDGLSLCF